MSVERARWGLATPTRRLTIRSGDRVVVQRVYDAATALRIMKATQVLGQHGIQVPLVRTDLSKPAERLMVDIHRTQDGSGRQ